MDAARLTFCRELSPMAPRETGAPTSRRDDREMDAVLRFTRYVVRDFVIGKYSLTKNDSDVFDQFQLHYLALDGFVLVSHDPDMTKRPPAPHKRIESCRSRCSFRSSEGLVDEVG